MITARVPAPTTVVATTMDPESSDAMPYHSTVMAEGSMRYPCIVITNY
jgi:hypothetical protein